MRTNIYEYEDTHIAKIYSGHTHRGAKYEDTYIGHIKRVSRSGGGGGKGAPRSGFQPSRRQSAYENEMLNMACAAICT